MSAPMLTEDDPLFGSVDLHWVREFLRETNSEKFQEQYPHPGLVLSMRRGEAHENSGSVTTDSTFRGVRSREELSRFGLVLIAKRPQNTLLPLMMTLGRSEKTDIALNSPTISKLHAFFYEVCGTWFVVDAGSSNGTFVEGLKLQAREPHQLISGQSMDFGYDVSCKFFLPEELASFLFE